MNRLYTGVIDRLIASTRPESAMINSTNCGVLGLLGRHFPNLCIVLSPLRRLELKAQGPIGSII